LLFVLAVLVILAAIFVSQIRSAHDFVSGVIEAEDIRLGSRVGGRVLNVLVGEGMSVASGQTLVELEPYDLDDRERVAANELAIREAELAKFRAGHRPEEVAQAKARWEHLLSNLELIQAGPRPEEIAAAENRLVAAVAQEELAQQTYDRAEKLVEKSSLSQANLDAATETLRTATATVEVRRNELVILQSGPRPQELAAAEANAREARLAWELADKGYRSEEIDAAEAARDAAQAALRAIQRQRQELRIVAPADGVIDALDLQPGDLVPANAPVLSLLSRKRLWIRTYVSQRFLHLKLGQRVRVTVDAWPGTEWEGEVTFIAQHSEFTPNNVQTSDERAKQVYRLHVNLPETDGRLMPGMTANVWIAGPTSK
jgi:multidrug resistance efflux pump